MNTFLYFNGDSYFSGDELADSMLDDYPGLADSNKPIPKHAKDWYSTIAERRAPHRETINRLEFERSFPHKTAQKLNLPFMNNSLAGSSMDRIARVTVTDLLELKETAPDKKIIACIGATVFDRYDVPRLQSPVNRFDPRQNSKWNTILPNAPENVNSTDYHSLINFYKNVIFLKDFCKLNDITLLWINFFPYYLEKFNFTDKDYVYFKKYANLTYALDFSPRIAAKFEEPLIVCPGGHWSEVVHEHLADRLAEIIKGI